MAGRTPAEAVHNFLDPLQRALSCVTPAVLDNRGGYHMSPTPHTVRLSGAPVHLRGAVGLFLRVIQNYRIVEAADARGPWKVTITAYYYSLETSDGQEVIAYHWHPVQRRPVTWPHLHLGQGARIGRDDITKAHLPTGWVAVEDVLRLAIAELGVQPLRSDWADVLDATQSASDDWRTW